MNNLHLQICQVASDKILKKVLFFIILLISSFQVNGQELELEWDGTETEVLRFEEGGRIRFAIEGHTASTKDRITFKIRGVDALTLYEGGTVRLEVVSVDNTAESVVVRLADGTLAVREQKNLIMSYFLGLPKGIQTLLDAGETVINILNAGAKPSDFYGLKYQGGLIFYMKADGTGLVSAETDQSASAQWGCRKLAIPEARGTEVGTGKQNTIAIKTEIELANDPDCQTAAAILCEDLNLNGYDDWFLPSKDELNLMYTNLHLAGLGGFSFNYYWSSSEGDNDIAWGQYFGGGYLGNIGKGGNNRVRAVRAF